MNWQTRIKEISHSHGTTIALVVAGEVVVALLIFHAGVSVGERHTFAHARFGYPSSAVGFLPHGFMPEGHGAVGTITNIALPLVTLQTRDGREVMVRVSSSTLAHDASGTSTPLAVGDDIIVIGEPEDTGNSRNIVARLIRILHSR